MLTLKLYLKNLSSNTTHRHRVLQKTHCLLLSSSDTACILSVLWFLSRYVNIVYLLDPQLSVCTPVKHFPSYKPPGWVSHLCSFGHANIVPLSQVQWNVKAIFCLFTHRKRFFLCSSKTTLRSFPIGLSPKATQILHSICERNPQFYSATISAESEICWNPKTAIRSIETGSKKTWFDAYPRYSFPIQDFLHMRRFSTQFVILILPEIVFQYNLKMKQCLLSFWPTDVSPVHRWQFHDSHI